MSELQIHRMQEREDRTKIQLSVNGKADVSRLWALTLDMRIGSAIVKMGGVAGVGTDETERGHGYASLILNESTRYFVDAGHDIALLFGIPDFYHKFGYAPVLTDTTVFVQVQDIVATGRHR